MAKRSLILLVILGLIGTNIGSSQPLCRLGIASRSSGCCCSVKKDVRSCCAAHGEQHARPKSNGDGLSTPGCHCRARPGQPITASQSPKIALRPVDGVAPTVCILPPASPDDFSRGSAIVLHDTGPPTRIMLGVWRI